MDKLPIVDQARVTAVYDELKHMQIKLDPNPIQLGPRRFNANIAKVRAQLDRVEQIFLQVSQDLHIYKRKFNETSSLYELEKNELMLNDLEVRQERSQKEREAKADTKLRSRLDDMRELELRVYDLEQLMVVIKAKRTDLKDKQGRMRDQMKLIEHDLSMGARWGSKAPVSDAATTDISSMLDNIDSQAGFSDGNSASDPTSVLSEPAEVEIKSSIPNVADLIPEEDSKGSLPAGEDTENDADSFLSAISDEKEESPLANPGTIDDLIGELVE